MATIIYICSPYSAPTQAGILANVEAANEYGKCLYLAGYVPLIPHRISALWDYDSRLKHVTHEEWLTTFCFPWLAVSDILVACGEWQNSKGCLMEIYRAGELNIKVREYEEVIKKGG